MSPPAFSAAAIAGAFWAYLADVDTGLLGSLRKLCTAPGAIIARQLAEPHHAFREPLRLFVFANLLFFLIAPQVGLFRASLDSLEDSLPVYARMVEGQRLESGLSAEVYEERFDNHLDFRQPTFAVLLVPLLALFAKLFDRRRAYGVHLMFALYAVSWILLSWPLLLAVIDTLIRIGVLRDPAVSGFIKLVLLVGSTLQWFVRAQHGGYARGIGAALLQGVLLTASWIAVMVIFRQPLFWLTWALLPIG